MIFAALLAVLGVVTAMAQMPENPVTWKYKMEGEKLHITATVEEPWNMYDMGPYEGGPNPTTFTFTLPEGVTLDGDIQDLDKPVQKDDPIFGMKTGYYGRTASFVQAFTNSTGVEQKVVGSVEWQVCDNVSCIAPDDFEFTFTVPATMGSATQAAAEEAEVKSVPMVPIEPALAIPITTADETQNKSEEQTATAQTQEVIGEVTSGGEKSLWSVIIEAILWGFAALLTPCVFPMVPMTVSFFIKSAGNKSRGRFLAVFYGISIVALYTLPIAIIIGVSYFGGGEAITADIFNWLATHWVPNVLFFLIFMVFAASFFGAFEITMPSKLVNRSDRAADKGGMLGVFFMAVTLVLVSFSCTGPIVGTIIVKSTQGEIWEPIITMLAFSAAFALPFTIFALFPALLKNLPKSGGWLNSVKVVLGFLELALGLKFLSVADQTYHWGLLDREVYLALWIAIFTLLGFYLLGKIRFAHDSKMEHISVKRLFLAVITFSFVIYMIPGMWGAPLKALSGYMPPMATQDFVMGSGVGYSGGSSAASSLDLSKLDGKQPKYSDILHLPHGLEGFFDFEEGMKYAKEVGKPVFLDFTGHGCVNCREMEANVWSDPAVHKILREDYVIIALYVDDKLELPEDQWVTDARGRVRKTIGKINASWQIERFQINAQPYYVLLDPSTDEQLTLPRAYDLSVDGFVEFLNDGLKAYRK